MGFEPETQIYFIIEYQVVRHQGYVRFLFDYLKSPNTINLNIILVETFQILIMQKSSWNVHEERQRLTGSFVWDCCCWLSESSVVKVLENAAAIALIELDVSGEAGVHAGAGGNDDDDDPDTAIL